MPLPHLIDRRPPWFAFLLHFREREDLYRVGAGSFLRRFCRTEDEFRCKMCSMPPLVAAEISFGITPVRGELIGIMRMPEDMLGPGGVGAVAAGVTLAAERGARVIGLGALTASITGGGLRLMRDLPAGVTLTNGNAYTAAVVRRNVVEASEALGLGEQASVAVVGCTGSVGVPASHLLAESGFSLRLVGRTRRRAEHELRDLSDGAVFAGGLEAVREADIVVLLTSDPSAQLQPQHVAPGTVVIDYAHPANIPPERREQFRRHGISILEGGAVQIPGYCCPTIRLGFGVDRMTAPACLAETYLLAREGIRTSSVGRPSLEFVRRLERAADRHGLRPAPLQALEPPFPAADAPDLEGRPGRSLRPGEGEPILERTR